MEELEKKIKELEARILQLEQRPQNSYYRPYYPQQPQYTPVHYHGQIACYNNPCVWSGYTGGVTATGQ